MGVNSAVSINMELLAPGANKQVVIDVKTSYLTVATVIRNECKILLNNFEIIK